MIFLNLKRMDPIRDKDKSLYHKVYHKWIYKKHMSPPSVKSRSKIDN